MAEEQQQQDSSKTLVSFVVGLLIGGMLVWAFSGPSDHSEHEHDDEIVVSTEVSEDTTDSEVSEDEVTVETTEAPTAPALPVGDGSIMVSDQPASALISLERATYPINEGWIGVRDYNNGQLGFILGVVQFSEAAGIVPENIVLQTPTQPGREYAVVIFESDGVRGFNAAGDVQLGEIYDTFTAE